ncbi:hypothetical protein ACFX13_004150 [Malus domestica]
METLDQNLVSSWFDVQSVPQTFVHPPEKRPGNSIDVPPCKNIPVVDLGSRDRSHTIQQISKASQDFGFFQVFNHGVCKKLIDDIMSISKEFHKMPRKDKIIEGSKDPSGRCKFYTSSENYANEEVHYWRDALTHPAHSSENYMQFLPQKPTQYREVFKAYVDEVRNMGSMILEMLAEGLGLSKEFFNGGLSENPTLLSNHYPPCPDPTLTLGLTKHRDPSLITILLQDSEGLQVFKDGNWIGVEPISSGFVVNIGYVMQMISNSKFKGADHRVVTNSRAARTTIAYFIYPSNETVIEPANVLCNPPLYRSMKFTEFLQHFKSKAANDEEMSKIDMEPVDQKLVSSWHDVQSVPQTFVQPPEKWPGKDIDVPLCNNIPVVDLRGPDWSRTIEQISEAIQEFGFFQVINHGVSKKLIDDTMNVSKDFHAMPRRDKETENSKDPSGRCKFYTSCENYANEEVHY